MTVEPERNDEVRATLNGKVSRVYSGTHQITLTTEDGTVWYNVPFSMVTVTKKAPLPEPPIESIIEYYETDRYVHLTSGWAYIPRGRTMFGLTPLKWQSFDPTGVKILHRGTSGPQFLTPRGDTLV